jgi:hypothetical protein
MTVVKIDKAIGGERLQFAVYSALYQYINAELANQQTIGNEIDDALYALRGTAPGGVVPRTVVETMQLGNIHYGHRPSMINGGVEDYPAMSVMVYRANPSSTNANTDYGHSINLSCAIEATVKSDPFEPRDDGDYGGVPEEQVGKRIKRVAEAINAVINDHPELDGNWNFAPPENAGNVIWGDIFVLDSEESGRAVRYLWQGVRIEYTYLKQTSFSIG